MRPLLLLLLLLSPPAIAARAQSLSPQELLAEAVARASTDTDQDPRFTRFDLEHNQNRNEKGKLYTDTTLLYEDTWIAGLPFKRLVEVNGRPLSGKALKKEQQRYDQAVRDRSALDLKARAALLHHQFLSANFSLSSFAGAGYRLANLREETRAGQLTRVIEATPIPSPDALHPAPTRHALLWITPTNPTLLHVTFDLVADEPTFLRGSRGEQDFFLLDGTPVLQHAVIHFLVDQAGQVTTVDTEHTFSRYRRFTTTTTMLPVTAPINPATPPEM